MEALPQTLAPALFRWYEAGHRALPWRQDREPYHVWLSEIMLQQTRVEAVKGYYARFLAELPTIAQLAACAPDRCPASAIITRARSRPSALTRPRPPWTGTCCGSCPA